MLKKSLNRKSNSQCRSPHGFQTSHLICDGFCCKLRLRSIQNYARHHFQAFARRHPKYCSRRSLRRHDLSFTGYVRRQCVKDVSGPKRSRLWFKSPCFRHSDARQICGIDGATMALSQYPRLNIGDGSRDSNRRGLNLGMKHVEAVIVGWQSAAGRRYCQWCLILASGAVSHGDGALSLNCVHDSRCLNTSHNWSLSIVRRRRTRTGEDSCWARSVLTLP